MKITAKWVIKRTLLKSTSRRVFFSCPTAMTAVVLAKPPSSGIKHIKSDDGQRKLPRPIVFWSLNEKTAYRRNRVVQTRMNMIMDDIATQRETSRKTIRYEAHKFRQKNSRYYSHPLGFSEDSPKGMSFNIAPPNWKPPNENKQQQTQTTNADSDVDYDSDDNSVVDVNEMSPRKKGIITRSKKPAVKFSVHKEIHQIETDLQIDDLDNLDVHDKVNESESIRQLDSSKFRALSAPQYREIPDLPGQVVKRQQSAFPALRTSMDDSNSVDKVKSNPGNCDNERNRKMNNLTHEVRKSDNYFDRSKAAYQLRQDLRKRAKMRKQGIKPSIFTLQDALNLEKENFFKSKQKVVDYIRRVEEMKKAEQDLVNKWNKDAIVHQLNL